MRTYETSECRRMRKKETNTQKLHPDCCCILEDHQGSDVSQYLLSLKTCTLALRSKTFNIFYVSLHAIK